MKETRKARRQRLKSLANELHVPYRTLKVLFRNGWRVHWKMGVPTLRRTV